MSRCELSIYITTKEEIRELNKRYRGIDRTTDVLSFEQMDDINHPEGPLGDIVVSEFHLRRWKKEGKDEERMLLFLCIHGLLHLIGFDHKLPSERKRMRQEQERLMELIR